MFETRRFCGPSGVAALSISNGALYICRLRRSIMETRLEVKLFGELSIAIDGDPITGFASRKVMAVIAYLVCNPYVHQREFLAEMLWDGRSPVQAAGNLRVVLSNLRKKVNHWFNVPASGPININLDSNLWVDIYEFTESLSDIDLSSISIHAFLQGANPVSPLPDEQVARLQRALEIYKGDLLYGFAIRDAAQFDRWLNRERERYRLLAYSVANRLTSHFIWTRKFYDGLVWAERQLQLDSLNEEAHQKLMVLLYFNGQRNAAVEQFDTATEQLEKELGIAPSPETFDLFEQIRRGTLKLPLFPRTSKGRAAKFDLPRMVPHNLQGGMTKFVGREAELTLVTERLFNSNKRLITIAGPGGIGKTRLGERAAWIAVQTAPLRDAFADGVYFVSMNSTSDWELIPYTLAEVLSLDLYEGQPPLQALITQLADKELLLVLDNFEHLIEGRTLIKDLLVNAQGITILLTSREYLQIQGEWRVELTGLPYRYLDGSSIKPGSGDSLPAALELFEETASQVYAEFTLTEQNVAYVQQICESVDGMPLGVEIAASLVDTTSCAAIAQEVARNKDILKSAMLDVPPRQRSLRAVFDHSWALLADELRETLKSLAIFKGSFSLDAAKSVANATARSLEALVAKSLLRKNSANRYVGHVALQQYLDETLAQDRELKRHLAQRQALYYSSLLAGYEQLLVTDSAEQAAKEISLEILNLRAAWHWAVNHQHPDVIAQMLEVFTRYYHMRGLHQEGETTFRAAIERLHVLEDPADSLTRIIARLLIEEARFQQHQAKYEICIENAQLGIHLAHSVQATDIVAHGCFHRGVAQTRLGDAAAALPSVQEARRLAIECNATELLGDSLYQLAVIEWQYGDYESAQDYSIDAADIYEEVNNLRGLANVMNLRGILASHKGNFTESCHAYEEALRMYDDIGDMYGAGFASSNVARAYAEQGKYDVANQHYARAMQINMQTDNQFMISNILLSLGRDATLIGDFNKAIMYLSQALEKKKLMHDQRGESEICAYLSLLAYHQQDYDDAIAQGGRAYTLAERIQENSLQAFAQMNLGRAREKLGDIDAAEKSYKESLSIRSRLGQMNLSMEPLAGLARIAHLREDTATSSSLVGQIFSHLVERWLDGTDDPFQVVLTCHTVLSNVNDKRALDVLRLGHEKLHQRMDSIIEPGLRGHYRSRIQSHQQLDDVFQKARDLIDNAA